MATTLEYKIGVESQGLDQAANAAENLGNELKQTQVSNEQLEESLKRQEARIKTLDGAINILGGTVETVAGALVLSGAASEESAKKFEEAAIGAIALADGTKRVFDGVKTLNEGLAGFGGIAGAAVKAFNALKAAAIANPFTAIAVAIGAVVSALLIYNQTSKETEEQSEETKKAIDGLNKSMREQQAIAGVNANSVGALAQAFTQGKISADQLSSGLKALGINTDGINLSTEKNIELVNKLAQANNNIASQTAKRAEAEGRLKLALEEGKTREAQLIRDEIAQLDIQTTSYRASADAIIAGFDAQRKSNEQKPTTIELTKQETTEVLNYKDAVEKRNNAIREGIELFIKETGGIKQPEMNIMAQLPPDPAPELEKRALSFYEYLVSLNMDLTDFFESQQGKAVGASLATAATFAKTLAESQDDSTKEAFEASKKYKIAAVVTSAIQSSFEAFGAAQQFGPVLGPILGAVQVAAIAVASKKAINDIQSSTFESSTTPTPSTGGGARANIPNPGMSPSYMQGGFLAAPNTSSIGPAPMRAYVVSGDVEDGLEADQQLQRRRRLGPG